MIKCRFGAHIKRFNTDDTKDFFNQTLSFFFHQEGIVHELFCVNIPQQNRAVERKNSHLFASIWIFLFQNHAPKQYWGKVIVTATYLINRLPSKLLDFESSMDVLPTFYLGVIVKNHLARRMFECVVFVTYISIVIKNSNQELSNMFLQYIP